MCTRGGSAQTYYSRLGHVAPVVSSSVQPPLAAAH